MRLLELSTTAGRGIRDRRHDRRRVVFAYRAPHVDPAMILQGEPLDAPPIPRSRVGRGLASLRTRQPGSPVGGTVARPLADAVHTLLILRAR